MRRRTRSKAILTLLYFPIWQNEIITSKNYPRPLQAANVSTQKRSPFLLLPFAPTVLLRGARVHQRGLCAWLRSAVRPV